MPECKYCEQEFEEDTDLVAHLDADHDPDELSRIDRKRVRSHGSDSGLAGGALGRVTRRRVLGTGLLLAGAGGVGVAADRWVPGGDETDRTARLDGAWTRGPELPYRAEYPAVTAYDGEMYVFGGADEENVPQAEAYRYAPEDETWTELSPMPVEGQRITATRLGSQVYIIDGRTRERTFGDGSVRIYDLEADSWSLGASRPVTTRDAGQTTDGERIYTFGGNFGGNSTDVAHAYDPGTDSWEELSPLPFPNRQMSCHHVPTTGRIYLFGGESPGEGPERDAVVTYDPETDSYDDSPAGMPAPSQTMPSTVHDGLVLFPGGEEPGGTTGSRTFRVYDPQADEWDTLPALPEMVEATDSAVIGDRLFVPGGRTYLEPDAELDEEPHTYRYEEYPVFLDRMQVYRFDATPGG